MKLDPNSLKLTYLQFFIFVGGLQLDIGDKRVLTHCWVSRVLLFFPEFSAKFVTLNRPRWVCIG